MTKSNAQKTIKVYSAFPHEWNARNAQLLQAPYRIDPQGGVSHMREMVTFTPVLENWDQ